MFESSDLSEAPMKHHPSRRFAPHGLTNSESERLPVWLGRSPPKV